MNTCGAVKCVDDDDIQILDEGWDCSLGEVARLSWVGGNFIFGFFLMAWMLEMMVVIFVWFPPYIFIWI